MARTPPFWFQVVHMPVTVFPDRSTELMLMDDAGLAAVPQFRTAVKTALAEMVIVLWALVLPVSSQ